MSISVINKTHQTEKRRLNLRPMVSKTETREKKKEQESTNKGLTKHILFSSMLNIHDESYYKIIFQHDWTNSPGKKNTICS